MRYLSLNEWMNIRMWIIKAAYSKRVVSNCFQQWLIGSRTKEAVHENNSKKTNSIKYTCVCATYLKKGCPWEQFESQSRALKLFSTESTLSLPLSPRTKQWSTESTQCRTAPAPHSPSRCRRPSSSPTARPRAGGGARAVAASTWPRAPSSPSLASTRRGCSAGFGAGRAPERQVPGLRLTRAPRARVWTCHAPASRPSDRIAPAPRPASVASACEKTDTYGAEAMRWRTVGWALGNGELRLIPNPRKCSSTQYLMTRQRSSSSEKICRRRTMARLPLDLVAAGGGEFSWKAPTVRPRCAHAGGRGWRGIPPKTFVFFNILVAKQPICTDRSSRWNASSAWNIRSLSQPAQGF